ncbi:MAG: hypothetical protein Q7S66_05765 [bacterium]|nr:hypothetical protein [bacterium]
MEKLSLGNLHQVYHENHARWPRKVAAEVAFALAVAFKRASDNMREGFRDAKNEYTEMAIGYAAQCFTILSRLPADSLEDVAPTFTSLAGVAMPNYFYLSYITNKDRCSDFVALLP